MSENSNRHDGQGHASWGDAEVEQLAIPELCRLGDVLRILQISRATYFRLKKYGAFPIPELPKIDKKIRFSGAAVRKFIRTGVTGSKLMRP